MLNMRSVILIIFQLRGMKLQSSKPGDRTTNRVKKKLHAIKSFVYVSDGILTFSFM